MNPLVALAQLRSRWRAAQPFLVTARWQMPALAAVSVLSAFAEAVVLVLLVQIAVAVSSGTPDAALDGLPFVDGRSAPVPALLALGGVLSLARLALQVVAAYLPAKMSTATQAALRKRTYALFVRATWDVQSREREGHLQDLLTGQIGRASVAVLTVTEGIAAAFNFGALLAAAVILNPPAAAAIAVAVAVLFLVLRPLSRVARAIGRRRTAATVDYVEAVTESARLLEEVQVFGVGDAQVDRVSAKVDRIAEPFFKAQFLSRVIGGLYQSLALGFVVGGLAALYLLGPDRLVAMGAVVLILLRGLMYSQTLQGTYHRLNDMAPDMERVAKAQGAYERNARAFGSEPLQKVESVELRKVTFSYRPETLVLRDISMRIGGGEAIGIVGPSGAGKSSLIQVLLRLRIPLQGEYLVNGRDARAFSEDDWTSAVSYLPQDSRLIAGTVAENIRFFRDGISDDEVEAAARMASIHEEILSFAKGYDTVIGQRADAVSGGQRQRICLARALVRRPSLLILDEPTSALDLGSEAAVQKSLEDLRHELTLVIVAHRLSVLNLCDTIFVIENGRIIDAGAPFELRERNAFFRRAVQLSQQPELPSRER